MTVIFKDSQTQTRQWPVVPEGYLKQLNRDNVLHELQNLGPSEELVQVLRKIILEYQRENQIFKAKLDVYLKISNDRDQVEKHLLKMDAKVRALQEALKKMQTLVLREKERANSFQFKYESSKLKEDENRLKIRRLLEMTQDKKLQNVIACTFNEPNDVLVSRKFLGQPDYDELEITVERQTRAKQPAGDYEGFDELGKVLKSKVVVLESALKQQEKFNEEKFRLMEEEHKVSLLELVAKCEEDAEKISNLAEKLKERENNLYQTNKELVKYQENSKNDMLLAKVQSFLMDHIIDTVINTISWNDSAEEIIERLAAGLKDRENMRAGLEDLSIGGSSVVSQLIGKIQTSEYTKEGEDLDLKCPGRWIRQLSGSDIQQPRVMDNVFRQALRKAAEINLGEVKSEIKVIEPKRVVPTLKDVAVNLRRHSVPDEAAKVDKVDSYGIIFKDSITKRYPLPHHIRDDSEKNKDMVPKTIDDSVKGFDNAVGKRGHSEEELQLYKHDRASCEICITNAIPTDTEYRFEKITPVIKQADDDIILLESEDILPIPPLAVVSRQLPKSSVKKKSLMGDAKIIVRPPEQSGEVIRISGMSASDKFWKPPSVEKITVSEETDPKITMLPKRSAERISFGQYTDREITMLPKPSVEKVSFGQITDTVPEISSAQSTESVKKPSFGQIVLDAMKLPKASVEIVSVGQSTNPVKKASFGQIVLDAMQLPKSSVEIVSVGQSTEPVKKASFGQITEPIQKASFGQITDQDITHLPKVSIEKVSIGLDTDEEMALLPKVLTEKMSFGQITDPVEKASFGQITDREITKKISIEKVSIGSGTDEEITVLPRTSVEKFSFGQTTDPVIKTSFGQITDWEITKLPKASAEKVSVGLDTDEKITLLPKASAEKVSFGQTTDPVKKTSFGQITDREITMLPKTSAEKFSIGLDTDEKITLLPKTSAEKFSFGQTTDPVKKASFGQITDSEITKLPKASIEKFSIGFDTDAEITMLPKTSAEKVSVEQGTDPKITLLPKPSVEKFSFEQITDPKITQLPKPTVKKITRASSTDKEITGLPETRPKMFSVSTKTDIISFSSKHMQTVAKQPNYIEVPPGCTYTIADDKGADVLHYVSHEECNRTIKELNEEVNYLISQNEEIQSSFNSFRQAHEECHTSYKKLRQDLIFEKENRETFIEPFKKQNTKLMEQVKVYQSRLSRLAKYRNFEIEGFKTDVKCLKESLLKLQKEFMKSLLQLEHSDRDLEMLQAVHKSTKQTKFFTDEVKQLKVKLYHVECDIKAL